MTPDGAEVARHAPAKVDGTAFRAAATDTGPNAAIASESWVTWTIFETFDKGTYVYGASEGGTRILHRYAGGDYLYDRATGTARRVDTYFDGTPLPPAGEFLPALSGDGSTVAMLRLGPSPKRLLLRVVRPDSGENFDIELPDPGSQTWSSGSVEECYLQTVMGRLRLSHDGTRAWFTTEPCYYDRLLAIDITTPTPRWSFTYAPRNHLAEVTADGKSFAVGWDYYWDYNWNQQQDPDEEVYTGLYVFPIEFTNDTPGIASASIDWPSWRPFDCSLPDNSRAHADGSGSRLVASTDQVGLDPDTVVYTGTQQYYWLNANCQPHAMGPTAAYYRDDFRVSADGRTVLTQVEGGVERRAVISGARTDFGGVSLGDADPLLSEAVRGRSLYDPASGSVIGGVLESTSLGGQPRALKVAVVGDSYISGEGTYSYEDGTDVHGNAQNLCHRSPRSWAAQLGRRLASFRNGLFRSFACSGATTDQIRNGNPGNHEGSQVEALDSFDGNGQPVDIVFASGGGNDMGFKETIVTCMATRCLVPPWKQRMLDRARGAGANVLRMLQDVKDAAPGATVFLTGYPSIVDPPSGACQGLGLTEFQRGLLSSNIFTAGLELAAGGLRLDESEQTWLNGTLLPQLNEELEKAAVEAGVRWIDPSDWFDGHSVCSERPYGNGLAGGNDFPPGMRVMGNESFHPNGLGYDLMQVRVERDYGTALRPGANPSPIPQGIQDHGMPDVITVLVVGDDVRAWGDQGRYSIQNLEPGQVVVVGQFSSPTLLGTATADENGVAELEFEVPLGQHPGLHTVVVYDAESGEPLATTLATVDPPAECLTGEDDVDRDGDALADHCDAALHDGPAADEDGDGIPNLNDDCSTVADPGQQDANENGIGDACDPATGYDPVDALEPFPDVEIPRPAPEVEVAKRPAAVTKDAHAEVTFTVSDENHQANTLTTTCVLDGKPAEPCSSPYTVDGLLDGPHSLEIRARNPYGAASEPAAINWRLDRMAPKLTVYGPTSSSLTWTEVWFFGQDVPVWYAEPVTYRCSLDAQSWQPCASPYFLSGLGVGSHILTVFAADSAGNESLPISVAWTVTPLAATGDGPSLGDGSPSLVPELDDAFDSPTDLVDRGLLRQDSRRLWQRYLKARGKLAGSKAGGSRRERAVVRARFKAWYLVQLSLGRSSQAQRTLERELRRGAFGRSAASRGRPSRNASRWAQRLKRSSGTASA